HFTAPTKVRYAAAQFAPAPRAARIFLRRAKATEISRFINRCLNTQDAAFVIAFKGVFIDPVLNPYAIRPATPIALHVLETHLCRAVHKPQHLFTAKGHHRVMHQGGINACKGSPVTKHHIGSVLGLGRRPVVVPLNGTANLSVQRMALFEQRPQKHRPVGAVLLIHQRLGAREIVNPRKTVNPLADSAAWSDSSGGPATPVRSDKFESETETKSEASGAKNPIVHASSKSTGGCTCPIEA